jgi:hypothetical protein
MSVQRSPPNDGNVNRSARIRVTPRPIDPLASKGRDVSAAMVFAQNFDQLP